MTSAELNISTRIPAIGPSSITRLSSRFEQLSLSGHPPAPLLPESSSAIIFNPGFETSPVKDNHLSQSSPSDGLDPSLKAVSIIGPPQYQLPPIRAGAAKDQPGTSKLPSLHELGLLEHGRADWYCGRSGMSQTRSPTSPLFRKLLYSICIDPDLLIISFTSNVSFRYGYTIQRKSGEYNGTKAFTRSPVLRITITVLLARLAIISSMIVTVLNLLIRRNTFTQVRG
ncbi:hypothetical protein Clacol_005870 [Clathrus columnatus]|uniref:Uncharacterized protein n=1 Tax=Clathrus columnatus TaxID=1419009 RepID=A0AAV5AG17_9AGAM|nr:hypothetical protein Clacol_005870 [Clathrus columnatus]